MREKLIELEEKLKHHSHDQTVIEIIQDFAKSLSKTRNKQVVFGSDGVLLREPPITYQEVIEKALISQDEDPFSLLQGDIVSTDAAYFFGERRISIPVTSFLLDFIKMYQFTGISANTHLVLLQTIYTLCI